MSLEGVPQRFDVHLLLPQMGTPCICSREVSLQHMLDKGQPRKQDTPFSVSYGSYPPPTRQQVAFPVGPVTRNEFLTGGVPWLPTGSETGDTYVTYWKENWGYLCYLLEGKLGIPMLPTGRKTGDTYVTYWKENWGYLCYLLEGKLRIPMLPTGRKTGDTYVTYWKEN